MSHPITDQCLRCGEALYHDFELSYLWTLDPHPFPVLCHSCSQAWRDLAHVIEQSNQRCAWCCHVLQSEGVNQPHEQIYTYEGQSICYDCKRWLARYPKEYLYNRALFPYQELFRDWIHDYKTNGDAQQGYVLRSLLRQLKWEYRQADWVVLPSSPASLDKRAFHATGLLLDYAGIPYHCPWDYIGDNIKQATKSRQDRITMKQPFRLRPDTEQLFRRREIVIFDDVYTTGATMLLAKQTLIECFPDKQIRSLTLARGQSG